MIPSLNTVQNNITAGAVPKKSQRSTPNHLIDLERTIQSLVNKAGESKDSKVLDALADSHAWQVQLEVIKNRHTSPNTRTKLANSHEEKVLHAGAQHPKTPLDTLSRLEKGSLCADVAENPKIKRLLRIAKRSKNKEVLDKLAKISIIAVRETVAKNKSTAPDTLQFLGSLKNFESFGGNSGYDFYEPLKQIVAVHHNTPDQTLGMLAEQGWEISDKVRENPKVIKLLDLARTSTGTKTLEKLSNSPIWFIRSETAKNIHTGEETVIKLSKDNNPSIRSAAALHLKLPYKNLVLLTFDESIEVRLSTLNSPNATQEIAKYLANDAEQYVRDAVSPHFSLFTSNETIYSVLPKLELTEDNLLSNKLVAALVDKAKITADPAILVDLSKNPIWLVRKTVAENIHTLPATLSGFAKDPHPQVRIAAAKNTRTPLTSLGILANDENLYVIDGIQNQFIIEALKGNPVVKELIAKASKFQQDEKVLDELARNPIWFVRLAVADNNFSSKATLEFLSNNHNQKVSKQAKETLKYKIH